MSTDKPSTTLPCPAWCARPRGHGFGLEVDGRTWRGHHRQVASFKWPKPDRPSGLTTVTLLVEQGEGSTLDEEGVRLDVEPVEIVLDIGEYATMTGPEARQLAAALLDDVDLWDVAT